MLYLYIYVVIAAVVFTATTFNTSIYCKILFNLFRKEMPTALYYLATATILVLALAISPIWLLVSLFRYPKQLPYYLLGYGGGKLNIVKDDEGYVTEINGLPAKQVFITNVVYTNLCDLASNGVISGVRVNKVHIEL